MITEEGVRLEGERVPTDPRLSRRRRAIRRSRRRRFFVRAAVVLAVAVGLWAAFWSPLLAVRSIHVVGGRHTTPGHVAAAAGLEGDNLLLLSTSEVARRVATLPWVKDARVERKLPATVRVRVTERRPAMIVVADGRRWTIDLRGRVLTRGRLRAGLPVLVGSVAGAVTPGETVPGEAIPAALSAYRSLPRGLNRRVVALFAPSEERVGFSLEGGTLVRMGAAERLGAKVEVLRAILRRLARDEAIVSYVDVRVPESPAISNVAPPSGGEATPGPRRGLGRPRDGAGADENPPAG